MNQVSRAHDIAAFGRRVAAAQGMLDERPETDWLAYGQACYDALARRRPLPLLLPASSEPSPPPPPPPLPQLHAAQPALTGPLVPCRPATVAQAVPTLTYPSHATVASPTRAGPATVQQLLLGQGSQRSSLIASIVWGLGWRYAILGGLVTVAAGQAQKPWLLIVLVLVGGQALGMWRRRWMVARVWRTLVIAGGAVYVAPMFSFYPTLLIGSIGTLTITPLVDSLRRR